MVLALSHAACAFLVYDYHRKVPCVAHHKSNLKYSTSHWLLDVTLNRDMYEFSTLI